MRFEMSLPRRPSVVLAIVAVLMTVSGPARAQASPAPTQGLMSESQAFYAVVNGAIGGVSAAVRAWHGHRSVRAALIGGTAGGLVTYGGMRLIGESTPLRVPGLMLTGVGASLSRNAAAGVPALSRVVLPMPLGSLELGLGDSVRDALPRLGELAPDDIRRRAGAAVRGVAECRAESRVVDPRVRDPQRSARRRVIGTRPSGRTAMAPRHPPVGTVEQAIGGRPAS